MNQSKGALVALFLCAIFFVMPWATVVSDPFYVHVVSILASLSLVIACYFLSSKIWSVAIQVIECGCIIYQAEVISNWDNPADKYYINHDEFMLLAFILELIFILASFNKIKAGVHGIANTLRRAFLSLVYLYPSEHSIFTVHNNERDFNC